MTISSQPGLQQTSFAEHLALADIYLVIILITSAAQVQERMRLLFLYWNSR